MILGDSSGALFSGCFVVFNFQKFGNLCGGRLKNEICRLAYFIKLFDFVDRTFPSSHFPPALFAKFRPALFASWSVQKSFEICLYPGPSRTKKWLSLLRAEFQYWVRVTLKPLYAKLVFTCLSTRLPGPSLRRFEIKLEPVNSLYLLGLQRVWGLRGLPE